MESFYNNTQLDSNVTDLEYTAPVQQFSNTTIEGGAAPVFTINGASGPSVNFDGGTTGYGYTGTTLTVANAATVRSSISAAKSGVNTDITELNGASQVDVSSRYEVAGTQVVSAQGAVVADAAGGVTIDAEARTAINTLLARLRAHGLIDT